MPQLKIKKKNIATIQFCLARYPDELVRVYPQMQQTNPNGHNYFLYETEWSNCITRQFADSLYITMFRM